MHHSNVSVPSVFHIFQFTSAGREREKKSVIACRVGVTGRSTNEIQGGGEETQRRERVKRERENKSVSREPQEVVRVCPMSRERKDRCYGSGIRDGETEQGQE